MKNNYKELSINENENNIHKEPLKMDSTSMGGNLERSYSSPNLLQVSTFDLTKKKKKRFQFEK